MGDGLILRRVAEAKDAQDKPMYILNQIDEKKVRNVKTPVKDNTSAKFTKHFAVESSPSVP